MSDTQQSSVDKRKHGVEDETSSSKQQCFRVGNSELNAEHCSDAETYCESSDGSDQVSVNMEESSQCGDMESDDDFESYLSKLSQEVMSGSQPLPAQRWIGMEPCNLPDHILENIFSCIPGSDMLSVCTCVCHRWNDVIRNKKFMPWKKLYLQVRSGDSEAYERIKSLCLPGSADQGQNSATAALIQSTPILSMIRLMNATGLSETKQTLNALKKHRLFGLACEVVRKRVLCVEGEDCDVSHCWGVAATILCLSASSSSIQRLRTCLLITHPLHVVMDFFYLAAVASWLFYKEKLMSQEFHYKLFCNISSIENATFPKPIDPSCNPDARRLTYEQLKAASHSYTDGEVVRIIAYAGTGKTTTLASSVKANPSLRFLYTSFGKAVVDQGKEVFSGVYNVECRTLHSLAFAGMNMARYRNKLSRGPFRGSEVRERFGIKPEDKQMPALLIKTMNRFVSSRARGITLAHVPTHQRVIVGESGFKMEEITLGRRKMILQLARRMWQRTSDLDNPSWTMTDDCYLKQWQLTQPAIQGFDVIMLDEAQDCTECMKDLLERQTGHCALVLVGDSHQQIYGFRLASDALISIPVAHSYYLTQSFRFGRDIAMVADAILRSFKFNTEGGGQANNVIADKTLLGVGQPGTVCGEKASGQVAILCRSNLGVVKQVLSSLQSEPDKKVAVVGGAHKLGLDTLMDLYALTKPILERRGKLRVKRRDLQKYASLKQLENEAVLNEDDAMLSKIGIVKALGDKLPQAIETLKGLPDLQSADTVVSTVHKAKGLEFDTVVLSEDYAKTLVLKLTTGSKLTKFLKEEANLLYVAATRAKKSLLMSSVLCDLLSHCKIHFLSPQRSSNSAENSLICVRCKTFLPTTSLITLHQPKIAKMQEKGPLCQKCGALLAPGWGQMLGDLNEIAPGVHQVPIVAREIGLVPPPDDDSPDGWDLFDVLRFPAGDP